MTNIEESLTLDITASKVLIVEGKDELLTCQLILNNPKKEVLQIIDARGKERIKIVLRAISRKPDFKKIASIGILLDADLNCINTFKGIKDALRELKLPFPATLGGIGSAIGNPQVLIFISPNNRDPGKLEDVFLEAIAGDSMQCIENYLQCMEKLRTLQSRDASLYKVYSFLAVQKDPRLRLGESVQRGDCWDFEHSAFSGLCTFLKSL